jgi:hypothetical protein
VTRRWIVAAVLGAVVAPLATVPAFAGPRPKDRVVIEVVKVNGSGCRKDTATIAMSPDNAAFTVTYSGYLAQVGVGAKKNDFRKDCKLRLKVGVPKGFTFAIDRADYRGFAHLEAGATGRERASYYFQGAPNSATIDHPFAGPFEDDWQVTDVEPAVYEPCGKQRALNIDTELQVDAGTSNPRDTTSFLAMDSADAGLRTTYRLTWQTC